MRSPLARARRLPVVLDAPVFADAQEDDAVNDALDGEVEFALGELLDCAGRGCGRVGSPVLDFRQEIVVQSPSVPRLALLDSANLSKEPLRTASREKMVAISSQRFSLSSRVRDVEECARQSADCACAA